MIVDLMYDHEYDTVELLLEYECKNVETALEIEFGTKDLTTIIKHFEELAETIVGNCDICGESVYADQFYVPPEEYKYAHWKCVNGDTDDKYVISKKIAEVE